MAAGNPRVKGMSQRALAQELIAAVDILADPLAPARRPFEYAHAYRDLFILISDDDRWQEIFAVREGAKTNYVIHALGSARVEFLKRWRDTEIPRAVNE